MNYMFKGFKFIVGVFIMPFMILGLPFVMLATIVLADNDEEWISEIKYFYVWLYKKIL